MSLNATATHVVMQYADRTGWAEQLDELLDMLGLVDEHGNPQPDDTNVYAFTDPSAGPGAKNPDGPSVTNRQEGIAMTTPPGLANLPPLPPPAAKQPKPKVVRPKKERQIPECGQYKAYARHRRLNEPIDTACQEACNEYGRAAKAKARELKRLLDSGVNPETAQKLAGYAR